MELQDRLNQVFRRVFNDDDINITCEMTAADVSGWDSLSHINLIVAVENEFKITFTNKEVMSFGCIGDLLRCLEQKTAT